MKYHPSKRVIWLLIPLLPVLFMSVAFWVEDSSYASRIATRGAKPPEKRLLATPLEWADDGISAFMGSELNPWKRHNYGDFGSRFDSLKNSKNPQDQEKYRDLMKLGKEWYERILARYPELAVTYRTLPEDKNGLLQWYRLAKRLRDADPSGHAFAIPDEFKEHLRSPKFKPWNPATLQTWLNDNRSLMEEARAIALMPDQSSGGITPEERERPFQYTRDFARAFLLEARLFAEQGDPAQALESIRAATGITNHLRNGGAPTLFEYFVGGSIQQENELYVLQNILPSLPAGQADVSAWEKALNPTLRQPREFSQMMRSEWNQSMPNWFLPALADPGDPNTPGDAESLAEAYTQSTRSQAAQNEHLALTDLPNNPVIRPSYTDLSRRSREIAKSIGMTEDSYNMRDNWERRQSQTGMTQAAFAILKGEPIPNDPIRGLPYQWDPATRKLSLPDIPEYRKSGIKPMVLPKL